MTIHVEKIEGKEAIARLLDMMAGGDSERTNKLREAKHKMIEAGFSENAVSAFGTFRAGLDKMIEVMVEAMLTAEYTGSVDSAEFALATGKYLIAGLSNCYGMMKKADLDPELFGLKAVDEKPFDFLANKMAEFKRKVQQKVEFEAKDSMGATMKLSAATEGEAAVEALSNLGHSLFMRRK